MDFHEPSEAEVLEFEQGIDDFVAKISLPDADFSSSAYHALTLVEDRPRCILVSPELEVTGQPDDPSIVMISNLLGQNIFALRHLLERLWKRKHPASRPPTRMCVDGTAYSQMGEALDIFNNYHSVCHALKGYRTGHWNTRISSNRRFLEFIPKPRHDGYDALSFCFAGPELEDPPWLLNWMTWVRFPETRPDVVSAIVKSARVVQGGRIIYNYERELGEALATHLRFCDSSVPDAWKFPWGAFATVRCLVTALHLRCMYHLCAIHFTAVRHNVEGGGVDDLCLLISRGKLVQELHKITRVPLAEIVPFVAALTFGQSTTSPDPALQPLIPLGKSAFVVPCMLIGSMRSGRNMLTLHARLDADSFDAQSAHFEREMLVSLERVFRAQFQNVEINAQLPRSLGGEELDLIIVDERSQTVFIGEARATIMPADPSEVYRRLTEIERKVKQLQRKIRSVHSHLAEVIARAGVSITVSEWQVVGAIILRGHAGTLTQIPEIPVVPEQIISVGVSAISSARHLYEWLVSHIWLPKPGIHFTTVATSHRFGEYEVKFGGIRVLKPTDYLQHHLPASVVAYSK